MIYHPKIEFRRRSNYDEKLVVTTFNPDTDEVDSYLDMEPVYTDNFDGTLRTDYGAKYKSVAMPSVTLIDLDGDNISPYKVRSVLRWLTGSRQNAWLDVYNLDGEIVCSYLGRFTDVKLQKMDARVIGIRAEFTSISPWAYSAVKTVTMQINDDGTEFEIDNQSDDLYSYVYPHVTFKNIKNGANFSITNNTVGEETVFKQLQQGEVVTIDNNFVVYSDNAARIFNDDFNFVFPALSSGTNSFKAVGNGELVIQFRYPMKVSDGLLNDYEIGNEVTIYVNNATVKIRGNVDLNPPIGVNVKVVDTTMFVRGELKNVEIASDDSVISESNGVLTIDDSESVCPFDEFNAEVLNGRLIIKKSFKDAAIKE